MKTAIIVIVVIAVIGVAGFALMHKSSNSTKASSTPAANTNQTQPQPASSSESHSTKSTTVAAGTMDVTVKANDNGSTPETISVAKGQKVNMTFSVMEDDTYHGGLEFTSSDPQFDSGAIAPGKMKTISFTANKSFSIQPWWPQKQIKKAYVISVNEQ